MCIIKGKHKVENQENCLETTQLDDKINYLEKKVKLMYRVLKTS